MQKSTDAKKIRKVSKKVSKPKTLVALPQVQPKLISGIVNLDSAKQPTLAKTLNVSCVVETTNH